MSIYESEAMALASSLVPKLIEKNVTVSTAESCTGGLIGKLLTDVPGSSAVYMGGVISYTNQVKMQALGVKKEIIDTESEVSYACAEAMANGAKNLTGSQFALSTTGFAGPGGGNEKDPCGCVYIAVASACGTHVTRNLFAGSREDVRYQAAICAMKLLEKFI